MNKNTYELLDVRTPVAMHSFPKTNPAANCRCALDLHLQHHMADHQKASTYEQFGTVVSHVEVFM